MSVLRDLACEISDSEKEVLEQELFSRHTSLREKESEKKDIAAEFSKEIKQLDDRIDELVRVLRTGVEVREVRCEYRNNPETGVRELVRTDTGMVVESAPMSLFDDDAATADADAEEGVSDDETEEGLVHVPGEEEEWLPEEEGPRALIGDGSEDADCSIVEGEEESTEV